MRMKIAWAATLIAAMSGCVDHAGFERAINQEIEPIEAARPSFEQNLKAMKKRRDDELVRLENRQQTLRRRTMLVSQIDALPPEHRSEKIDGVSLEDYWRFLPNKILETQKEIAEFETSIRNLNKDIASEEEALDELSAQIEQLRATRLPGYDTYMRRREGKEIINRLLSDCCHE